MKFVLYLIGMKVESLSEPVLKVSS